MTPLSETPPAEIVRPAAEAAAGELPPMPSEDQPYFNESLRASLQGLGKLIRARRKPRT
jgi:hypothetical protein